MSHPGLYEQVINTKLQSELAAIPQARRDTAPIDKADSSNLSNAALTSGLEWNTKVTKRDLPETIDKIAATFEYYWNDREFEYYAEADKDYSPTTMYNDYSINESLFHWQSQSTTAEDSPTGQRYIHHRERGIRVLLFVREFKVDCITGSAEAYTYLGTANYVKHDGSRPMNITWKLDRPIPAKFLKKTNKLVVG